MQSFSVNITIILLACFLPYIFSFVARRASGFDAKKHDNPRSHLASSHGLAARANAVQQNSFEGLPLFIAAMLTADYIVLPDFIVFFLGSAYLVFRLAYGLCYLANWSAPRSVCWLLATACPVLMLLLSMQFL